MEGRLERRDFMRLMSAGSALLLLRSGGLHSAVHSQGADSRKGAFTPDVEIELRAARGEAPILPGAPTRVFVFQGRVLKGDRASLQPLAGGYGGPIIRARRGQRLRIHFINDVDGESIIHWHGLHLSEAMDAHPRYAIPPGQRYVYEFEVTDRPGTYWYHPHPHGRTGRQIYLGLASFFLVSDDAEEAALLPQGEYDLPLLLQDRSFGRDNQFVYLPDDGADGGMMGGMGGGMMDRGMMGGGMGDMMAGMMGFFGDRILVNGRPDPTLSVAARAYRLRLLNGSNARIYKLAWSDGTPLTVIATDGGLLAGPVQRPYVTLAPGERVDLWADFSGRPPGSELVMRSLAFEGTVAMGGMGGGMMGGMMGSSSLPDGAAFPVFRLRVERKSGDTLPLPKQFGALKRHKAEEAINLRSPRTFEITMGRMRWGFNGRSFEMERAAESETVRLGTLEAWEFSNDPGGMMAMAHSIHVHGLQFQVLERRVAPGFAAGWNSVSRGYVDEGWKDTVLIMPGERVRLLLKFEDYTGLFPYHCHMLEHGDSGLMRNYRVEA